MIEGIDYLEKEEFIRIPDFPDYYISNCGRVYSSKTKRCIGCKNPKTGYIMVSLLKGKRSKTTYMHHLVMQFFGESLRNVGSVRSPKVMRLTTLTDIKIIITLII